jgi:hypothetical protein
MMAAGRKCGGGRLLPSAPTNLLFIICRPEHSHDQPCSYRVTISARGLFGIAP